MIIVKIDTMLSSRTDHTSSRVTVRMLPNKKDSTLVCTMPELIIVMAMPTDKDRIITSISSAY